MPIVYAQHNPSPHAAHLGPIQDVDTGYELARGVPRLSGWPSAAHLKMDSDFGIKLDDVTKCLGGLVVISDRLRNFLEPENLSTIELLPVTLFDIKSRPVPAPHFLLHATALQEALDLEASGAKPNAIDPTIIRAVQRLVIREDRVNPDAQIFRLAGYFRPLFFRRNLADRIRAEGFTGIAFGEIETFDRFSIL